MSHEFEWKGNPLPQPRPRFARVGKWVSTYYPSKHRKYKEAIAKAFLDSRLPCIDKGPISVEIVFTLPRPKSVKQAVKLHDKRPDIDNYAKAVLDALNGLAWKDDGQIASLKLCKEYAEYDTPPGFWMEYGKL